MKYALKRTFYLGYALLGISMLMMFALTKGDLGMRQVVTENNLQDVLDDYAGSSVSGLQYIVVDANETRFAYARGWADVANKTPMTLETTMMAYSMTKTLTAVAVLQLVEQGKLGLEDEIERYLPNTPYAGHHITIRHLLAHTSGLPNPIPIRWAHLVEEDSSFDEAAW
jgi:D-alanyl-D-alanine carboxypeptidase